MSKRQSPKDGISAANTAEPFDYNGAFIINSGLLSAEDQQKIKQARITVMGMFAGGSIAVMLARAGACNFTLIDHRSYQIDDMNRDIGCFNDTLGCNKAEVIKKEILRINPQAGVEACTGEISLKEIGEYIENSDVYFAQADDLALSAKSLVVAQRKKRFAISFMPSGMTGYVIVLHPDLPYIIDPTDLFGSPKNLTYKELYRFLRNPLNRCGRRWHITEGKWRIDWFNRWRDRKVIEAQLCPNAWLGASLASMEAIKYLTGKWKTVRAPRMWHLLAAEGEVKAEKFRRRSRLFGKLIYWTFSIKLFDFGRRYQKYTALRLLRELEDMQRQENEGREVKPPFMWRHLI